MAIVTFKKCFARCGTKLAHQMCICAIALWTLDQFFSTEERIFVM